MVQGTANGMTGAYEGNSLAMKVSIVTFVGVSWYNAIELCVLVFVTFTHYRGLYFYSLLISAVVGVVPYSVGFLIKFFELATIWLSLVFLSVGWWVMITGQSFVLYSRLHLVLRDQVILRRILYMIIANVFILHVPTTILTFGSNSDKRDLFLKPYNVMEKIQMTGFGLQEFIISTLYIWETIKMLRLSPDKSNRKIMYQLISINVIFILMDLGLLACAYADLYVVETTLKATIYSVKLKLEFAVLGKLVHLVNASAWNPDFSTGPNGYPDFVDASRLTTDVTHAPPCANSPPKPPWSQDPLVDMNEIEGPRQDSSNQPNVPSVNTSSWDTGPQAHTSTPDEALHPLDLTGVIPPVRNRKSESTRWPS
ncbi:hypothetical protein VTO42DRAFT_13 [Malbranchea cinnamomea]